jgi:hypothetical protein
MTAWSEIGRVEASGLVGARVQAHHAVQWATRAARAVLAPKDDDSHTNLGWDSAHAALLSHDLGGDKPLRIGLRPADMTLIALNGGRPQGIFALNGESDAAAGDWTAQCLTDNGLDGTRLDGPLPYDLPPRDGPYDLRSAAPAFRELARYYGNASSLLGNLAGREAGASPVRCWPHHFDIATLIALEGGDPEHGRSIGVGLSPGDESYAEPYFYVSPWPYPEADRLDDVAPIGRWHTAGFVAYVVTGSEIAGLYDGGAAVRAAVDSAIARCRDLLGVTAGS